MDLAALKAVIAQISYKDWKFHVYEETDAFVLQVQFMAPDAEYTDGGVPIVELQKCRKWRISRHSCTAEIVRTCYKAVEAAEIHEMQERFKYRNAAIFSPHLDPDILAYGVLEDMLKHDVRKPKFEQHNGYE